MNSLKFSDKYISKYIQDIDQLSLSYDINKIYNFFINKNIDVTIDQDIISSYTFDWSNIKGGYAEILFRPKNSKECAIILKACQVCKIPITISAGRTNLTGSATPFGGAILSIQNLITPNIKVDNINKIVTCPIGIQLEEMRNKILEQSNNTLYYPVDPTSRNDALVGGTLSCNASGFVPGEKGATRYWVHAIEFILINGYTINIERGQYISKNGEFNIICNNQKIIKIPNYKRPKIKNASGPFSAFNEEIDFIDFIIGSEGIFGFIAGCKFKLMDKPQNFLDLFVILNSENQAIKLHQFLYRFFNNDMGKLTALEYFGYNCQKYMQNRDYFFNNNNEVAVYIQMPVYNKSIDDAMNDWIKILQNFDSKIDLDKVISLNDLQNWNKFFESRHSMPDNALSKTKELGGISIITDTIVPPENFKYYLDTIHKKLQNENIEYLLFGHLGDCHLHFHLIPNSSQEKKALKIYDFMVDLSSSLGGVYSAEHGTGKRKKIDFEKCYGKKSVTMIKNTKKVFDSDLLLNRGNIFKN